MTDGSDRLAEDLLVDAYGDDEQLTAFAQAFEASLPFRSMHSTRRRSPKVALDDAPPGRLAMLP
jgi:hypothetical protein